MSDTLQVFNFEKRDVRVVMKDGEPWWVAKDVCDVLGLGNPSEALKALDDDELTSETLRSGGQGREMRLVSESGVYALIFRSNKPEAKRFCKWVTSEVLPQIRRTGRYTLGKMDYRIAAGKLILEGLEAFGDAVTPGHKATLLDKFTKVVVPTSYGRSGTTHAPEPPKDKNGKPLYTARSLAREFGVTVNRVIRATKKQNLRAASGEYGVWRNIPGGTRFFYNETGRNRLRQYFTEEA